MRQSGKAGRIEAEDTTLLSSGSSAPSTPVYPPGNVASKPAPRKPNSPTHARQIVTPSHVEYTTRPLGTPPVNELAPRTASQQIRLQHRASMLIQKYCGSNFREAQRTKWLLDVVMHIDIDYRDYIKEQAVQIEKLHQQLTRAQVLSNNAEAEAAKQYGMLKTRMHDMESLVHAANQALLRLQEESLASEKTMRETFEKAQFTQAGVLQTLAGKVSASEASVRKQMAQRAYLLREELLQARSQVRQGNETDRRHKLEVAALLTIKETGMAAERHCLEEAFKAQTSAVHRVERAAAQVEVSHVRMELEAYKEPWVHLYKNKSPTQNKAITQALGLTAGSMHVCVPF